MSDSTGQFDGGRELELLRQRDPFTGNLLQRLIEAMNRGFTNAGVAAEGDLPAPAPVDSTSVQGSLSGNTLTVPGEILHFVHTHNAPLTRGIQYITEIDTDPNFPNPHPIDTGTSRSGFTHLPANDHDGNPVSYYLRVTPQLYGSAPAKPTVYGGVNGPIAIQMTGSTNMTLLTSQSAGTARPGQGGKGLGPVQERPAVGGPKRNLSQQT